MNFLRWAVTLLALANAILFALASGVFGPAGQAEDSGGELSPDRIRIVPRDEAPPPAAAAPGSAPEPAPVCVEVPALSHAEADRVAQAAAAGGVALVREVAVPDTPRWWVHIPPPPNGRAGAEKKAAELRKLGIRRFSIVEDDGEQRHAISFGRYASEVEAQKQIDGLKQKGVRSVRLSVEPTGDGRQRLIVRGSAERVTALQAAFVDLNFAACGSPADPSGDAGRTPAKP